jgi:2',3'-cyclic-nucleotide 2'-phosphodiesterase (5'-nucleotidase family)
MPRMLAPFPIRPFAVVLIASLLVVPGFGFADDGSTDQAATSATDAAAAAPPPAPTEPSSVALPLLLLGGFKGEFGLPNCRAEGGAAVDHSGFARLVARIDAISSERTAAGELEPLVLHTGDLHFPGALSSHLIQGGEDGMGALFELMERIPYDGVGLGGLDLSLPPDRVTPLFAEADKRGFPLLGSNISCAADAPRPAVCAALGTDAEGSPFRIIERGGVRVAILSILDPSHEDEISSEKRAGLTLGAFADTVTPLVKRLRGEDLADLIVVLHHSAGRGQELSLLGQLPGIEGIDLVVNKQLKNGLWGKYKGDAEGRDVGWSVVPGTNTLVMTAGRGVSQAVFAEFDAVRDEDRWRLVPKSARLIDATGTEPDPDTHASIDALGAAYCSDWGAPIQPDVALASPMDVAGFQRFTLDAMRDEANTELSILNAGALRHADLLPVSDPLTRADLRTLLPFGGTLVRGVISGEQLWFFTDEALVGGIERVDGSPRVNGRPIDVLRNYSVVMNRFVADGGDGILPPGTLKKRKDVPGPDGTPLEVVDLLESSLKERRFVTKKTGMLDPTRKHVNLHLKPAFRFSGYVNASYSKVAVENPEVNGAAAYSKGELLSYAADKFQGDARLGIKGDSRDHAFGTSIFVLYSFARFEDEFGGMLETGDWVRGRLNYDFVGLRSLAKDNGFVPVPFIEGQISTEFDKPVSRDWHRLELTAIAGAKIRPLRPLTIKVGFNARREVLEPDSQTLPGIYVGYTLQRSTLFEIVSNPVELESETSWFFNDIGRTNVHEIRHNTRLFIQLFQKLHFTASIAAYAYREEPIGAWGAYMDLTLGVSFGSSSGVQSL